MLSPSDAALRPTQCDAQDAIAAWVQAARAAGKAIPVPPVVQPLQAYSGKILVRVPRSLHARLARREIGRAHV